MNYRLLKTLFSAVILILVLSTSVFAAMKNISASELQSTMKSKGNIYLLDVRTLGEYIQKRIKGGHLIPIDQIQSRIREIPKDRPVIVYCETGMRSTQVGRYLDSLGYKDVSNLSQGIMSWQLRGYEIESGMP